MANIKLNNNEYSIPDSALAAPTADFVAHLATIEGEGIRVVVDGVEYNVDPSKVADAVAEIEALLESLNTGSDEPVTLAAGLYKSGTNYTELMTSWDDLVESGAIVVNDGAVSVGTVLPDDLPEKNEYGFYYGMRYDDSGFGLVFYEDGSVEIYEGNELSASLPAQAATYGPNSIDASSFNFGIITVSSNGETLIDTNGYNYILGSPAQLDGDLLLPSDGNITTIGFSAFYFCTNLSSIIIPDSVTIIDDTAFFGCTNLSSIIIPDSVTIIGGSAFAECANLNSVEIGENSRLTTIREFAFEACASLASIEIPVSVTVIEHHAFLKCTNLNTINYKGTVEQWGAIEIASSWNMNVPATYVQCSDGQVAL